MGVRSDGIDYHGRFLVNECRHNWEDHDCQKDCWTLMIASGRGADQFHSRDGNFKATAHIRKTLILQVKDLMPTPFLNLPLLM